jgi:hypothetical protein
MEERQMNTYRYSKAGRMVLGIVLLLSAYLERAFSADVKTIQTHKTQDIVITLESASGQWTEGKNTFVVAFSSPETGKPVDVGQATLSTSMPMPGMAPMLAGAALTPDAVPGRYVGTIRFPDRGARQVTVTWDGPAGQGSARFSVPVR